MTYRLDLMLFCQNWSYYRPKLFDCETVEFESPEDYHAIRFAREYTPKRWIKPYLRRENAIFEAEWNLFRKRPGGWDFVTGGMFPVERI